MLKINVEKLTIKDFEILKLHYQADINEVVTFEKFEDFFNFCEVIGFHEALEIIKLYGLYNTQDVADAYGIDKPFKNIEALASYILRDVLEKYLEESCETCEE